MTISSDIIEHIRKDQVGKVMVFWNLPPGSREPELKAEEWSFTLTNTPEKDGERMMKQMRNRGKIYCFPVESIAHGLELYEEIYKRLCDEEFDPSVIDTRGVSDGCDVQLIVHVQYHHTFK